MIDLLHENISFSRWSAGLLKNIHSQLSSINNNNNLQPVFCQFSSVVWPLLFIIM